MCTGFATFPAVAGTSSHYQRGARVGRQCREISILHRSKSRSPSGHAASKLLDFALCLVSDANASLAASQP